MNLIINILLECPESTHVNISSKQLDKTVEKLGKRSYSGVLKPPG